MSGPQDPEPPIMPQGIHRDDAGQAEVDARLADHARVAREQQPDAGPGVLRLAALLHRVVDGQAEQNRLLTEHTRLLEAILQTLQSSPDRRERVAPPGPEATEHGGAGPPS